MTYPYIKFPEKVEKYIEDDYFDLELLPALDKPKLKKIDCGGFLLASGCILILFALISFNVKPNLLYVVLTVLALLFILLSITSIIDIRKENKLLLSVFKYQLKEVCEENELRKRKKEDLVLKGTIKDYKQQKIQEYLQHYKPIEMVDYYTKKGISESFFIKFLFEFFGIAIKPFSKLYETNPLEVNFDYMPDFVFQTKDICIDIEIDEPYVLKDGKAIHVSDDIQNSRRDSFFTKHGWCVVRFAEEQVLLYPYECCKFIAQLIFDVTRNDSYLQKLELRGFPINLKQWTKEESIKMATEKYRKTLLLKAYHKASQLEFFPKNYFNKDNIILITKVGEWSNREHICLNNNFYGPKKIVISNPIFPTLKRGDTIELNVEDFILETDVTLFYSH